MSKRIHLYIISFLFLFLLLFIPINAPTTEQQSPVETTFSTQQTAVMSITPSSVTAKVGQNFMINITIADIVDLYGWEFKLRWNSVLLNAVNVVEGPFLRTRGDTFFTYKINNTAGYMLVDCTLLGNVPGVNGDGTLATVTFHVKSSGECSLDLYDTMLVSSYETLISHQTTDGYFTASSKPPTSTSCGSRRNPPLLI